MLFLPKKGSDTERKHKQKIKREMWSSLKYFCVVKLAPLKIKDCRAEIMSYLFTSGPCEIPHKNESGYALWKRGYVSERQEEMIQS